MRTIIRRRVTLWNAAAHGDQPHDATLIYRRDHPFAVELILPLRDPGAVTNDRLLVHPGNRDEISVFIPFSRALLIDGLEVPSGEGAVRVEPHIVDTAYVSVTLPLTCDGVEFYTERAPLEAFVYDTLRMLPTGAEIPIADAALDRWLAGVTA